MGEWDQPGGTPAVVATSSHEMGCQLPWLGTWAPGSEILIVSKPAVPSRYLHSKSYKSSVLWSHFEKHLLSGFVALSLGFLFRKWGKLNKIV